MGIIVEEMSKKKKVIQSKKKFHIKQIINIVEEMNKKKKGILKKKKSLQI